MTRLVRALAVLACLCAVARPAPAQEREGILFGVGFGYGSLGFSCDGCGDERDGSYSGNIRVGYALSPRFLVGVEGQGFYKDEPGGYLTANTVTGSVYYYPLERTPLFVRGGIGLGLISIGVDGVGTETETGFGWSLGVGYDIPVGPTYALTPYFNYFMGDFEDGNFNVFQFGLGLSVY
jgi:hypothetical protein